ncbi:MAG: hypothetical protein RLZ96_323 [Actinomycetota bacterium]
MSQEHYFSAEPKGPSQTREVSFTVAERQFTVQASSGTFSATRLDPGTSVLLSYSEEFPDEGNVLDLGCGWGPIALSIAAIKPQTKVWALDINQRSLDLVRSNAKGLGLENVTPSIAVDIPEDVEFSAIWSNPPIRIGKAALHELLTTWLPRLEIGGRAMLVVQKQLGSDSLLKWIQEEFPNFTATRFSTDKGYRILEVTKD